MNLNPEKTYATIKDYYGKVLSSSNDLKTDACCTSTPPPPGLKEALKLVPDEVLSRYYGCGYAVPSGIDGLRVLDLGSGSGRDCYLAAQMVGESGSVVGVDMTDEQLDVASRNVDPYMKRLGYKKTNLEFKKGYIEFLEEAGIPAESIDIVVSNCVINLSPDKRRVLEGVYRVLKHGGEFYFSDVYCDRRLPTEAREHPVLLGECLGGAMYENDFKDLCVSLGFTDPRVIKSEPLTVHEPSLCAILGNAKFMSVTYRLFKLPQGRLEPRCEDYGQVAVYKGKMTGAGQQHGYVLDDHHYFPTGKPVLVCGNSASMLSETWLKPYFDVTGDRSVHYGEFPCGPAPQMPPENIPPPSTSAKKSSCCPPPAKKSKCC